MLKFVAVFILILLSSAFDFFKLKCQRSSKKKKELSSGKSMLLVYFPRIEQSTFRSSIMSFYSAYADIMNVTVLVHDISI